MKNINMLGILGRPIKEYLLKRWGYPYCSVENLPGLLAKHLDKNKPVTLVDIGAHQGLFSKAIDNYCGVTSGMIVEANPFRAEKLSNRYCSSKWHVFDCAVVAEPGPVVFHIQDDFDATSSIFPINRECDEIADLPLGRTISQKVQGKTLDEITEIAGFGEIDLIKIDVQGAEHLVITGGLNTFERTKMVWTEMSFKSLYQGSSTFSDIYEMMISNGFSLCEIAPAFRGSNGEIVQCDALFINKEFAS